MPEPTLRAQHALALEERYLSPATRIPFFPLIIEHASGTRFTDVQGRSFLDFHSMACITNTGHNHPRIVEAIRRQGEQVLACNSGYVLHEPLLELAARLAHLAPGTRDRRVAFGLSGSDANDGALKLVRAATGRPRVIAFDYSYHGNTYGALSLSAVSLSMRRRFGPEVPAVHHAPFPNPHVMDGSEDELVAHCLNAVHRLFETVAPPEEVAAVFVEPIQGDAGIIVPPVRYLRGLAELCAQHDILLVADEVQTGMGRTGRWFAGDHFDLEPDVLILGKGLGSGMPISAVVARSDLMESWKAPGHVFSTAANPISCAAALATLDVIESEDLLLAAERAGERLRQGLLELAARHDIIGDIRGLGLMLGVDLVLGQKARKPSGDLAARVIAACFDRGLFLTFFRGSVLRLAPPLIISQPEIDQALEILDAALDDAVNGKVSTATTDSITGW